MNVLSIASFIFCILSKVTLVVMLLDRIYERWALHVPADIVTFAKQMDVRWHLSVCISIMISEFEHLILANQVFLLWIDYLNSLLIFFFGLFLYFLSVCCTLFVITATPLVIYIYRLHLIVSSLFMKSFAKIKLQFWYDQIHRSSLCGFRFSTPIGITFSPPSP